MHDRTPGCYDVDAALMSLELCWSGTRHPRGTHAECPGTGGAAVTQDHYAVHAVAPAASKLSDSRS